MIRRHGSVSHAHLDEQLRELLGDELAAVFRDNARGGIKKGFISFAVDPQYRTDFSQGKSTTTAGAAALTQIYRFLLLLAIPH